MLITQELFDQIEPGEIFRVITTKYQTLHEPGKAMITFVAVKGFAHDWTIYGGPEKWNPGAIRNGGDKVTGEGLVRSLVPCEDSVFKTYRY